MAEPVACTTGAGAVRLAGAGVDAVPEGGVVCATATEANRPTKATVNFLGEQYEARMGCMTNGVGCRPSYTILIMLSKNIFSTKMASL